MIDASPELGAERLFDGDATTGFTAATGKASAVRLVLGASRDVMGLGVRGIGRAKVTIYAEEKRP